MNLIVLHHLGAEEAGEDWRRVLADEGLTDVWAPDLAGHGTEPAPTGGNYTRLDPVYAIGRRVADGFDLADTVLVGVGRSGWSALVLAAAKQGCGLVLVDGLGTPWIAPTEQHRARRAALRALGDDPQAMAAAPEAGLDPRIAGGLPPHGDEALVREAAAAVEVPTLLIGGDVEAANSVAPAFGGGVTVIASAADPGAVAPHLVDWLRRF